ncbi:MAG TPA: hypothetical protein DDX81_11000 [Desulfofustis sp.]|nr:hypothetical protein [Desulfofustis sp.]
MSRYRKALVASGHTLVSEAGATILKEGGNAFDAVVAAGFAAAVAEPSLTSLGGGGLLVGYDQRRGESLFLIFSSTPPVWGESRNETICTFSRLPSSSVVPPRTSTSGLVRWPCPGTSRALFMCTGGWGAWGLPR